MRRMPCNVNLAAMERMEKLAQVLLLLLEERNVLGN